MKSPQGRCGGRLLQGQEPWSQPASPPLGPEQGGFALLSNKRLARDADPGPTLRTTVFPRKTGRGCSSSHAATGRGPARQTSVPWPWAGPYELWDTASR